MFPDTNDVVAIVFSCWKNVHDTVVSERDFVILSVLSFNEQDDVDEYDKASVNDKNQSFFIDIELLLSSEK